MSNQHEDIETKQDFNGIEITVKYDEDGREISYTSPFFSQTTTYDKDGVATYTDNRGNIEHGIIFNLLKIA